MAKPEHLEILQQGIGVWNEWRSHQHGKPSLQGAKLYRRILSSGDFKRAILSGADLRRANLDGADLSGADLSNAVLTGASLLETDLGGADLRGANLEGASLIRARFSWGKLQGANLQNADLAKASFGYADLSNASFSGAVLEGTLLGGANLSSASGLDSCDHRGPSSIDVSCLEVSGNLPINFLRGCGLPDRFIEYIPSLLNNAFEFYSCFISYSHQDKSIARRLHDTLQGRGIRCWLDEKQILPGHDIYEEVDRGIRLWDKVLLCCSRHSLKSWWVDSKIGKAFAKEQQLTKERGRKILALIPVNLDGYLFEWRDAKADELRRRYAADLTGWETNSKKFERRVEDIVLALRANDAGREKPPEPKL